MENKCKAAGGWNIACGLLIVLPIMLILWPMALLGLLGIELGAGIAAAVLLMFTAMFGVMAVPGFVAGIAFIVMGIVLRSKCTKGVVLKIFLAIFLLLKVLFAIMFLGASSYIWLAVFVVSIVYDVSVLFARREKLA